MKIMLFTAASPKNDIRFQRKHECLRFLLRQNMFIILSGELVMDLGEMAVVWLKQPLP